jgi:hypothetical protein
MDFQKDKELQEFRNLMTPPEVFEDGFKWSSLIGALFIALMMVPGGIYMQLVAGIGVGPAAQWVTVVLFIEVARRAHKNLKKPEVFVLFYMASAVMAQPFQGLIFRQFFIQSQAATAMGVAELLPNWYAPSSSEVLAQRDFFVWDWLPAVGLVLFGTIMSRINTTFMSFGLFKLASDIEKLPFPMAPVGAQGIMALVEQQTEESSGKVQAGNWRWRVFSIGGILGMAFGSIYMALPTISSALFGKPIVIMPIPFVDWTTKTSPYLPAVATGMTLNMAQFVTGMVLPFFAMVGTFIGLVFTMVLNPILYHARILTSWELGDEAVRTSFKNTVDFYFSFGLGLSLSLAIVGIYQVVKNMRSKKAKIKQQQDARLLNMDEDDEKRYKARGDIKGYYILGAYVLTSMSYILLSGWLIDWHFGVMVVLVFFAFIYTPLLSYVTARLEGMAGEAVQIPFIKEASFILSGYTGGVKVWFLPLPQADYGKRTVFWRQAELTGTKFWSIWKSDLILVPIVLCTAILFEQFIWSLGPIPGPEYPYAERMWELDAQNQCIIFTSTLGRYSRFEEAFNPAFIGFGLAGGLGVFALLSSLSAPVMLYYGLIRGMGQTLPNVVITEFLGALLGRYYFRRKMGLTWKQYIPVVAAGFSCGMGLITVFSVGINFLAKSVIRIPF